MAETISIGNTGEYFTAGELERHGFTAAIPMSNVKDFDILAIHRETHKMFAIQVQTTNGKKNEWTLNRKCESLAEDHVIYFFVKLNDLQPPEYHIVPSRIVAETVKKDHQEWLNTPGLHGQAHNDNNIRKFRDPDDEFLDRWDYLE